MSFRFGGRIVTDGLVMYLDAGNVKSYSGSGTIWNDLSPNQLSGSLINTPTFSTQNGGNFLFDGSNQYVNSSNPGILGSKPSTYVCVIKINTNTNASVENPIITIGNVDNNQMRLYFMRLGKFAVAYYNNDYTFNYNVITNTIYHLTFTENGSGGVKLYVNGVYVDGSTLSTPNTFTNNMTIARYSSFYLRGSIYLLKLYNRELSMLEIQQNYNLIKPRFGL